MTRRSHRLLAAIAVVACLAACSPASAPPRPAPTGPVPASGEPAPAGPPDVTVTVDAGTALGPLNNPSWYQNQSGPSAPLTPMNLKLASALGVHLLRVWALPGSYYDAATARYDFNFTAADGTPAYRYLTQASGYGQHLLVNLGECPTAILNLSAPGTCAAVLQAGITAYKLHFPAIQYIELFNEPDLTGAADPGDGPALTPADYYQWYKIAYTAVNAVNQELEPVVPLRLGGPATASFNTGYLQAFLDRYAADRDPAKRLDFLSYHEYKRRADPAAVATEKPTVRHWLASRGLDPDTPVFVTEYGVFPGAQTGTTFDGDLLTQAAAVATLGYYYVEGGLDAPLEWTFNHTSNDRKSMFVSGQDGVPYPFYNLVRMESMLKQARIPAHSTGLSPDGIGVNTLATVDGSGLAVLATNYQWTTGTASHEVSVRLTNLPHDLAGGRLRVDRYLIDRTTSNYAYDPGRAGLTRVAQYTVAPGVPVSVTFGLGPNAMSLVVVTPVHA